MSNTICLNPHDKEFQEVMNNLKGIIDTIKTQQKAGGAYNRIKQRGGGDRYDAIAAALLAVIITGSIAGMLWYMGALTSVVIPGVCQDIIKTPAATTWWESVTSFWHVTKGHDMPQRLCTSDRVVSMSQNIINHVKDAMEGDSDYKDLLITATPALLYTVHQKIASLLRNKFKKEVDMIVEESKSKGVVEVDSKIDIESGKEDEDEYEDCDKIVDDNWRMWENEKKRDEWEQKEYNDWVEQEREAFFDKFPVQRGWLKNEKKTDASFKERANKAFQKYLDENKENFDNYLYNKFGQNQVLKGKFNDCNKKRCGKLLGNKINQDWLDWKYAENDRRQWINEQKANFERKEGESDQEFNNRWSKTLQALTKKYKNIDRKLGKNILRCSDETFVDIPVTPQIDDQISIESSAEYKEPRESFIREAAENLAEATKKLTSSKLTSDIEPQMLIDVDKSYIDLVPPQPVDLEKIQNNTEFILKAAEKLAQTTAKMVEAPKQKAFETSKQQLLNSAKKLAIATQNMLENAEDKTSRLYKKAKEFAEATSNMISSISPDVDYIIAEKTLERVRKEELKLLEEVKEVIRDSKESLAEQRRELAEDDLERVTKKQRELQNDVQKAIEESQASLKEQREYLENEKLKDFEKRIKKGELTDNELLAYEAFPLIDETLPETLGGMKRRKHKRKY